MLYFILKRFIFIAILFVQFKSVELQCEYNTKIAILIPSTTKQLHFISIHQFALVKISILSFLKTFEYHCSHTVYVGIDKNDILHRFTRNIQSLSNNVRVVTVKGGTFTKTINALANIAYKENNSYFVRINDDTFFATRNWTTLGIKALNEFKPRNIGVIGPRCNHGNTQILTHDMVHRSHLDIFGFYYPPEFENWWADDWISKVYQPQRSKKLNSWIVHHKMVHGTRYKVNHSTSKRLLNLHFDKLLLNKFLDSI